MSNEIYFVIAADIARFKIGRTEFLPGRLQALRAGSLCPLECIAVVAGEPALEPACHDAAEALGFKRAYGEWFDGALTVDDACRIVQRARVILAKATKKEHEGYHARAFRQKKKAPPRPKDQPQRIL